MQVRNQLGVPRTSAGQDGCLSVTPLSLQNMRSASSHGSRVCTGRIVPIVGSCTISKMYVFRVIPSNTAVNSGNSISSA